MKIAVVLFFVLFLAAVLIAADAAEEKKGAGAGEAAAAAAGKSETAMTPEEIKKKEEEHCNTLCADKKEPALNRDCKEIICALNKRARMVVVESFKCGLNCGISPDDNSCREKCSKEIRAKEADVTATCNEACSKMEKEPAGVEKCKKTCTPTDIFKEWIGR